MYVKLRLAYPWEVWACSQGIQSENRNEAGREWQANVWVNRWQNIYDHSSAMCQLMANDLRESEKKEKKGGGAKKKPTEMTETSSAQMSLLA